jgi:hypothetical protein
MRKLIAAAAAAVICLAAPAALSAATYQGDSEQNRPVTLKVAKGKVKSFVGGINIFCIGEGIEFRVAIPPKAMKLNKKKKFAYEGRDSKDESNIEVSGKVRKGKVTGKIRMTDSNYDVSEQRFVFCSGTAKFTAKRG